MGTKSNNVKEKCLLTEEKIGRCSQQQENPSLSSSAQDFIATHFPQIKASYHQEFQGFMIIKDLTKKYYARHSLFGIISWSIQIKVLGEHFRDFLGYDSVFPIENNISYGKSVTSSNDKTWLKFSENSR